MPIHDTVSKVIELVALAKTFDPVELTQAIELSDAVDDLKGQKAALERVVSALRTSVANETASLNEQVEKVRVTATATITAAQDDKLNALGEIRDEIDSEKKKAAKEVAEVKADVEREKGVVIADLGDKLTALKETTALLESTRKQLAALRSSIPTS